MERTGAGALAIRIEGYDILSFLGHRGGTRVYQAVQQTLQRKVRLSVLPPQAAEKPAHRLRFERELAVVSELQHDNILGAIEAGEHDGARFVVTEDVAGRTLADAFASGRELTPQESAAIARDVAAALDGFEQAGYVHRWVTPHAIVRTEAGVNKLARLSRSKRRQPSAEESWFDAEADDEVFYRSPESIRGAGTLDVRGDIYGLGCVLYHMLAGRPPFRGPAAVVMAAHLERAPRPLRAKSSAIPEALERIVMTCLAKSRADRYQHASEVVRDLDAIDWNGSTKRGLFRRRS
jgi:serine/threonine-protein kinase